MEGRGGEKGGGGFRGPPVKGPMTRMPRVMVRPMPKPAIERKEPRSSTAVAKTTRTRKNEVTASSSMAERREKSRTKSEVPKSTSRHVSSGMTDLRREPAAMATKVLAAR